MTERELCFVCHEEIQSSDKVKRYSHDNKTLVIHKECLNLLGMLVREIFQEKAIEIQIMKGPDYSTLPHIQKSVDSEPEAILKVLEWAATHHPKSGVTPKELSQIFEDNFRWNLSNPSARLGELVERNQIRRIRDNRTYRYFSN